MNVCRIFSQNDLDGLGSVYTSDPAFNTKVAYIGTGPGATTPSYTTATKITTTSYEGLAVNPNDEENLKRIINYPVRGIGKSSIDRMVLAANTNAVSMWDILQNPTSIGLKGAALNAAENFIIMIKSFQSMLEKENAYDIAFAVGKQTGLVAELYNDKSVEGLARYENIQALLNSIKEYTETPDEEGELQDKSLGNYLQQITLLTDVNNDDADKDAVSLMTIHAAKGLEFPCVFSVGLEENLFPSAMSLYDRADLEEERRLFYVVVTRAKSKLWISYANTRYRFGSLIQNDPSRFLDEIPEPFLDKTFTGSASKSNNSGMGIQFKADDKTPSSLKKLSEKYNLFFFR